MGVYFGKYKNTNVNQNGLVLYLNAGNGFSYRSGASGNVWKDLSTVGNNGTITNNTTPFSGSNGGSIIFDGTNDYVQLNQYNLTTNGTLSAWIYRLGNGSPDGGNVVDVITNINSFGTAGWSLGLNVSTNKISYYVANNGSLSSEDYSTTSINLNTWYHVCATYDGTTKILYINGVAENTTVRAVNGNGEVAWRIGARDTNARYFSGLVSEVMLYNVGLSATEVSQNFNATRSRFGV